MLEFAHVATLVCSLLTGIGVALILFWTPKKGGGKFLKGIVVAGMLVSFFFGAKALLSLFTLGTFIGRSKGLFLFFLLDIAVFALAIFVGSRISKKKAVDRMKDNVVLQETVKRAKELHATAIYVLQDGAYLIYGQRPISVGGYRLVEVRKKEEYDNYVAPPMQLSELNIQDMSKLEVVAYRQYNYPNMDGSQRESFVKAFCQKMSNYRCAEGGITVTCFVPGGVGATGLTATATGYTVTYSESKDSTYRRDLCTYYALVLEEPVPNAQQAPAPQNQMNQW